MTGGRGRNACLALFGVGLAVSISIGQAFAGALLLMWGIRAAMRISPAPGERSPLEIPIVLYAVWGILTTAFAGGPFTKSLSAHSSLLLFFLAFKDWSVEDNRRWITWFCAAAALSGAIAIVQSTLRIDRLPFQDQLLVPEAFREWPEGVLKALSLRNLRARALRSHPLTFAETVLPALFLVAALAPGFFREKRWLKWAAAALIAAGIVLSQARGVWVGAAAGAAVLAIVSRNRSLRAGLLVAFVLGGLAVAATPRLRARALSIVVPTAGDAGDQASRSTRFLLWSAALREIKARPVAGMGAENMKLVAPDPLFKTDRTWSEAHNIFLQVGAERGLVGLGLLIWILVLAGRAILRSPPGWRESGLALFAGMIAMGLTESWIKDSEVEMVFWVLLGTLERSRLETAAPAVPGCGVSC